MKHDIMAQAITDLDDDLIEQAAQIRPRKGGFAKWCAAAACFLVVISAARGMAPGADTPVFFRDTLVGTQAMPISDGISLQSARALEDGGERIEVELRAEASERTKIRVSDGILLLESGEESDHCTISAPAEVVWVIEESDTARSYRMKVGRNTLLLVCDQSAGEWTLQEEQVK